MQAPLQLDLEDAIAEGSKAAERAYLDSIRPEIERAAREAEARGTLKSTVEAQKRAAAEKAQRDAEREARITEAVSIVAAKQREKGQRRNAPDTGPTQHRLAKLAGVEPITPPIDGAHTIDKAHMTQGVVEFYRDRWTYEELQGARYLVGKWHAASTAEPTITANYDGTPANAYGPRTGGLRGGEKTTDAYREMLNIEGILFSQLGNTARDLVKWFCWETVKVAKEGASMGEQMEAAGKSLAPFVKDAGRLWGITFGSLKLIFRFAYAEWVVKDEAMKRRDSRPEQVQMRRAQRAHRMGKDWPAARADMDGPAFKREGN